MANFLARLTTIKVPTAVPDRDAAIQINAPGPAGAAVAEESRMSVFIDPRALTFPIAVGLVKGAWEALKLAPIPGVTTVWFPLVVSLIIGLTITVNNLGATNMKRSMVWLGILVGLLNSLVMFAAVMGVSK